MDHNYIEARMQQKHDVAENWEEISNFVPKQGEIIIYDKDANNLKTRFKIGDGESSLGELKFFVGELYCQDKAPLDAGEGAVWITPDNDSFDDPSGGINLSGWTPNSYLRTNSSGDVEAASFDTTLSKSNHAPDSKTIGDVLGDINSILDSINNDGEIKPTSNEAVSYMQTQETINWDDSAPYYDFEGIKCYNVSNLSPRLDEISDLSIYIKNGDLEEEWEIGEYLPTWSDINNAKTSENVDKNRIFIINGTILNFTSNSYFFVSFVTSDNTDNPITLYPFGCILGSSVNDLPTGFFFFENSSQDISKYINKINFTYSSIKVEEVFQNVFKHPDAANVYVFDAVALANITETSNFSILETELSRFKTGDIILLPKSLIESAGGING